MEQRKGWSRVQQVLEYLELELETATVTLGKKAPETIDLERKLCLACCKQGAALMEEGDWGSSLTILRRAEALSVRYIDLQLEVFETLSLYYAGTGKHLRALAYLDKLTELTPENPLSRAKLHLNYCAILSQLSRHAQAQTHALKAVFLLQDSIILQSLRGLDPAEMELETLATAYYNLAVEQEHLHEVRFRQYHEARKWHKQALDFATQHLSEQNSCRIHLTKVEETAGNQVEQRIEIKEKRRR